jgi:hypothetical protein
VIDPDCKQYAGWPVTIDQEDNYGREARAYLPTLEIRGTTDPVVQITEEANDEIVYTLRIEGTSYRPKAFAEGTYTIRVSDGKTSRILEGVATLEAGESKTIELTFE